jgi:carboxymethylenebutenolidase
VKTSLQAGSLLIAFSLAAAGAVFAQDVMEPGRTYVTFPGPGGATLRAYLAVPSGRGEHPGVLMIPEWWGLNHDITLLADALAKQGYLVLAADPFRGKVAQSPEEAMKQVGSTPPSQIAADLDAALNFLRTEPLVIPGRIAVLGFCFGGTQAMLESTRHADLAATVIFYGPGPITDPAELGSMGQGGPMLGIFGEQDPNIPVAQVRAFQSALKDRGIQNTITIYPGVGHAFVKSTTYQNGEAAQKAWEEMLAFLARALKK